MSLKIAESARQEIDELRRNLTFPQRNQLASWLEGLTPDEALQEGAPLVGSLRGKYTLQRGAYRLIFSMNDGEPVILALTVK